MREWVDKFRSIERDVAHERGDFVLFALVEREGSGGKWDVVVSATWFGDETMPTLKYLAGKLKSALSVQEILSVSRIVLLDPSEEFVTSISDLATKNGTGEIRDVDFNGMSITRAYILSSPPDCGAPAENPGSPSTLRDPAAKARETTIRR